MAKMTFQPKKRQRSKVHGFRARMASAGGRKVLAARRAKGRKQLTVSNSWGRSNAALCVTFSKEFSKGTRGINQKK